MIDGALAGEFQSDNVCIEGCVYSFYEIGVILIKRDD